MGENPAALRAAVFSLASKLRGGAFKRPPSAGRGLIKIPCAKKCTLKCVKCAFDHVEERLSK